jgi:hypothetical protein
MKTNLLSIFIGITALLLHTAVAAQSAKTYRMPLYQHYLSNNTVQLEKLALAMEGDATVSRIELLKTYYVLLNSTFASENEKLFNQFAKKADKLGAALLKEQPENAIAHALMASICGFKIAYAPMKGMFLGPKSQQHLGQALKHGEQEPLVWLINGISKFNTPEAWGGSLKEALASFEKAVTLFDCHDPNLKHNWAFLHALAWLGIAQAENGTQGAALKTWQRALTVEPQFQWVKESLLPELEAKM